MSSLVIKLNDAYCSYKDWVSRNPQKSADLETTAKWVSYFVAGRINNSNIVSELIYSLSNLLVLFNDRIIYNSRRTDDRQAGEKLKIFLTVIEYTEVFIEITAKKLRGNKGKWAIVVVIQIIKCICKLLLLFHYRERITVSPSIPPLMRSEFIHSQVSEHNRAQVNSTAFSLKSGRVIRTVSAAPPIHTRSWSPPLLPPNNNVEQFRQGMKCALPLSLQIAEVMYIIKPICYLASLFSNDGKDWKPWLLSLGIDLISLRLNHYGRHQTMTSEERKELSRRTIALILYLLRTPYYERISSGPINATLNILSDNVPLAGHICRPIAHYLPEWQRTFFYMWSN